MKKTSFGFSGQSSVGMKLKFVFEASLIVEYKPIGPWTNETI